MTQSCDIAQVVGITCVVQILKDRVQTRWNGCGVELGKALQLVLTVFLHLSAVLHKAVASMGWMTLQVA